MKLKTSRYLCAGLAAGIMLLVVGRACAEEDILSPDEMVPARPRRFRPVPLSQLDPVVGAEVVPPPGATARAAPPPVIDTSGIPRVFSITELLASMLDKNFEIRGQRHAINAAHRGLQNARAQQLPTATFKTTYQDTNFDQRFADVGTAFGIQVPPGPGANPFVSTFGDIFDAHAVISGLSVKVPIFHGDQLVALPRAARVKEDIEIIKKEKLIQDLELRLVDLYVDTLFEDHRLALAKEQLAKKEEDLKIAQVQIKNTIALRQRQLQVELDIDDSRQEILEIENNIVVAKEQLARLTGLPKNIQYALRPGVTMKELNMSLDEILREARRTNPSIVAQMRAVDLANQQQAILKGKDHTTLDFQFDYNEHFEIRDSDHNASVYLASLVFAWDVYDGGRNLSEQKEGQEKREQVITDLETLVQGIEVQVRQVYNKYVENRKQLARSENNIELARENLRIVTERYEAQVLLAVDLQEAKVSLQKAIVNRDRALNQIIKSRARLYHLLGQLTANVFN